MKKYIVGAVLSLGMLAAPALTQAAALTTAQSTSLIAVVQSSPGTPASAFVNLITAFSNITVNQATSLIAVVQASPSTPATAFVDLLTSFTADTASVQSVTSATSPATTAPSTSTSNAVTLPTATLSPQTQTVSYGSTATVSWSSANAAECSLYDSLGVIIKSGSIVRGGVAGNYANGSISGKESTTYTYGCNNAVGGTGWKYAYVTVCMQGQTVSNGSCKNPITVQPVINKISVSSAAPGTIVKLYTTDLPPNSGYGYSVTFSSGTTNSVITATMDSSGIVTFTVPTIGTGTYQISAGASLTSYKTNKVTFTIEAPKLPLLALEFFTTAQSSVTSGSRVSLTWLAQNATGCTMSSYPSDATWNSLYGAMGSTSSGPITQTTTYSLACTNGVDSVSKSVTISVL